MRSRKPTLTENELEIMKIAGAAVRRMCTMVLKFAKRVAIRAVQKPVAAVPDIEVISTYTRSSIESHYHCSVIPGPPVNANGARQSR